MQRGAVVSADALGSYDIQRGGAGVIPKPLTRVLNDLNNKNHRFSGIYIDIHQLCLWLSYNGY